MTIPKNPRVAIYLRVSTVDQKFVSQADAVRRYCRARGWRKMVIYSEKESGAKASRTVLDRMLRDTREGKIDVIAVFKLDRLGRDLAHQLQILAELKRLNVAFIATADGLDTAADDANTRFALNILGSVAEHQREGIVERVRAGMAAAKRRGVKIGRPITAYGPQQKVIELRSRKPKNGEGPMTFKVIGAAAGVSEATAHRIWQSHLRMNGLSKASPPKSARRSPAAATSEKE